MRNSFVSALLLTAAPSVARAAEEALAKLDDRNLVILPAGGRHHSPAQLLASPRFKALIAELANTVDIAISAILNSPAR